MKKILIFLLGLFLLACVTVNENGFTEEDEQVRKEVYRHFGGEIRDDESVLWGNVIGFQKTEYAGYQVDLVKFAKDDKVLHEMYVVKADVEDAEVKLSEMELISAEELEYQAAETVDSIAKGDDLEAVVRKRLVAVDFLDKDANKFPGFLGKYDLILIENGQEELVDFSFDPFSTNIPFELVEFSADGQYLAYFVMDLGRLFNIYDVWDGVRTDVVVPGVHDRGFWYGDQYLVCSAGDDFAPAIALMGPDNWGAEDHFYVYPEELNQEEDVVSALYRPGENSASLECEFEDGVLRYVLNGEEKEFVF